MPGAGGMGLTLNRRIPNHDRIFIAISAAGCFCTEDGGQNWKPINRGCVAIYPDPNAEIGHCVHRIGVTSIAADVLFMQKHWDVMRSDDGGDNWYEVSGMCRATLASRSKCTLMSRTRCLSCRSKATAHYHPKGNFAFIVAEPAETNRSR